MPHSITPFLMFQGEAEEAMNFYVSLFPESRIVNIDRYGEEGPGPLGSVRVADFQVAGLALRCIDSFVKHAFTFTPSFSLFVECGSREEMDTAFAQLSEGGSIMMPPDNYGFSERFAWLNDRFGVSWQLNWRGK